MGRETKEGTGESECGRVEEVLGKRGKGGGLIRQRIVRKGNPRLVSVLLTGPLSPDEEKRTFESNAR